ncbi:hypothetical protein ACQ4PT_001914 [Festuca glaucescens]
MLMPRAAYLGIACGPARHHRLWREAGRCNQRCLTGCDTHRDEKQEKSRRVRLTRIPPVTPKIPQTTLGLGSPPPPAGCPLLADGDPHPHTPGDPHSVLHPPEEQAWRPSKNAMKSMLTKLRQRVAAALATGSPETSGPDIVEQAGSLEPEPVRLRHSFLYSDRPRRSKRSTSIEEHVSDVNRREFEALALDQSPPTPDLTHKVEKHGSEVSNTELEARTMHQSPPTLGSTPSIEEYASEVRALKLARSPPTLDSTHRPMECAYDTTNSDTGSEIVEEKPKSKSVPWAQRHLYIDIVEVLIAHKHGNSDPAQHKLDAEKYWAAGEEIEAPKVAESLASLTAKLAQGEASTKEIIENGKKWMGEEVMLAFEKYKEGKKQFETKKISDNHWSLISFFAEVKELYGRKYYSCYELSSYDDGHCYACQNQGMHALQHPILGLGYEGGHAAMGPPFVYLEDDDYFD